MADTKLLITRLDNKKSDPRAIMVYYHSSSAGYAILNCPRDSKNYVRRTHKCINKCKWYRNGLCLFDTEVQQY